MNSDWAIYIVCTALMYLYAVCTCEPGDETWLPWVVALTWPLLGVYTLLMKLGGMFRRAR